MSAVRDNKPEDAVAPVLSAPDLAAQLAEARARISELEQAAAQRKVQWPLTPLLPVHVSAEVGRRAAVSRELVAWQAHVGAHWFASTDDVEDWLRRCHWFKSAEAEARWRATIRTRTS
jgi:hypothetical protein